MFRKIILSLSVALLATSFGLGAQKTTTVEFERMIQDIGIFPRDSCLINSIFEFKNTGDAKLYFYTASPDCPCVSVKLPAVPVNPGDSGRIIVYYDGRLKAPGDVRHWIYLSSNADPATFRIRIVGYMTE